MIVTYSSTNSGGSWWLSEKQWQALERAGWIVHWYHPREEEHEGYEPGEEHRDSRYSFEHSHSYGPALLVPATPKGKGFLGAKATSAAREGLSLVEAIREWEQATGKTASDEGCNCCGAPHSFSWEDAPEGIGWDERYASGEDVLQVLYPGAPRSLREAIEGGG